MAMYSFRHRPPHQQRQGQAAPGRHRRRSLQRRQGQRPRWLRDLGQIPPPPPRGGVAVSKRTYSPGQKEHVISAQHARALAGVHAEQRHARAIAGAHACMSMHACVQHRPPAIPQATVWICAGTGLCTDHLYDPLPAHSSKICSKRGPSWPHPLRVSEGMYSHSTCNTPSSSPLGGNENCPAAPRLVL